MFNIVDIPLGEGRTYPRKGVCTGWLSHLATAGGQNQSSDQPIKHAEERLKKLSLDPSQEVVHLEKIFALSGLTFLNNQIYFLEFQTILMNKMLFSSSPKNKKLNELIIYHRGST